MSTAHRNTYIRDNVPDRPRQPVFAPAEMLEAVPPVYNASSMLDRVVAQGNGSRPAIRTKAGDISYSSFLAKVEAMAHLLIEELHIVPGDPVLIQSPNSSDAFAAWWAVLRVGAVAVSIMPMLRAEEIAKIVSKGQIRAAIAVSELVERIQVASDLASLNFPIATLDGSEGFGARAHRARPRAFPPVSTSRDDPAILAFTSGTTGMPKGCIQFHRDIQLICDAFMSDVLKPNSGDVFCCTAPMAFTFGLGAAVIFPVASGACVALPDRPGYDALAETIEAFGVTILATAPTAYRVLSKIDSDHFGSLRTCVSAGEHLSKETFEMWKSATGLSLIDGIGSTEMMYVFISARPEEIRPGATGKAISGYEAAILDANLQPLPPGEVGRLAVRGVTGCRYLDDDRQSFYVSDGWNITGDLFRQDEDGYFWFVSRADDLIVSSGYNIAAIEVENAVALHTAVREVAVIGVPDAERGQICKAFIVLEDDKAPAAALASDIQSFTKATIAPYKYPRAVEFVSELPKTHTGKLKRSALKTMKPSAVLNRAS